MCIFLHSAPDRPLITAVLQEFLRCRPVSRIPCPRRLLIFSGSLLHILQISRYRPQFFFNVTGIIPRLYQKIPLKTAALFLKLRQHFRDGIQSLADIRPAFRMSMETAVFLPQIRAKFPTAVAALSQNILRDICLREKLLYLRRHIVCIFRRNFHGAHIFCRKYGFYLRFLPCDKIRYPRHPHPRKNIHRIAD